MQFLVIQNPEEENEKGYTINFDTSFLWDDLRQKAEDFIYEKAKEVIPTALLEAISKELWTEFEWLSDESILKSTTVEDLLKWDDE